MQVGEHTYYDRETHAAHYEGGGGHDLECWTTTESERPECVPANATQDYGYMRDGVQHWVWRRIAPLSGPTCTRCGRI